MKIKGLKGQSGLAWFLEIFVAAQFALIIYVNFALAYHIFDYDSSLAFRHGMEMWKHGLFLKDFSYYSTLEIDTVAFFGSLIYLITGNLGLALAVPHMVGCLVIALVIWDICGHIRAAREQFLMALAVVFTPYTMPGMLGWSDMIFICGGQYGFRLAVLLLLLDLLLMCEEKQVRKKKFAVLLSFYLLLVFWTSLSVGNFVLCMIIFPLACWVVLEIYLCQEVKAYAGSIMTILLSVLFSLAGWLLRSQKIGTTHRENLSLVPVERWFENLHSAMSSVFLLFGGGAQDEITSVFSKEGIAILLRFALLCCLLLAFWYEWRVRKNRSSFLKAISVYFFVYISVLLLVDTRYGSSYYEYRYHLPWCFLLAVFGGVSIAGQWKRNGGFRNGIVYGFLLLAAGINLWQGYQFTKCEGEYARASRVIRMAENLETENVYYYNGLFVVPRVRVFAPDLYCVNMLDEEGLQADTGDFYVHYGDRTAAGDANMLVCNDEEEFEQLPIYIKSCYRQVEAGIYWSETNPWDGVSGLPGEGVDVSVDFPYSAGYFGGGEFADNGVLVGNQTENDDYLLRGPNTEPVPGTYDITLSYGSLQEGRQPSRLEVIVDDHVTLAVADLPFGEETVTLKGVEVSEGNRIEFRIWKPKDAILTVKQFTFKRIH